MKKTVTKECEVVIDLEDFDSTELIQELDERNLSDGEKDEIESLCDSNGIKVGESQFPTETMNDERKIDYLKEVFPHYTLEEIESALPRRY